MPTEYRFLFNFSVAYTGGGYKRLYEYARWFNERGGASFVIHRSCAGLQTEFANNRYFTVAPSQLQRLYDDCGYLRDICAQIGQPELYYAYGIPLYRRVGLVNWSHLNNVLHLGTRGIPLSPFYHLKFAYLGLRTRRGFTHADVISAESHHSLQLIRAAGFANPCLSVNGSDDELQALRAGLPADRADVATVVGTYSYKALDESVLVFEMLKREYPGLTLQILGDTTGLPRDVRCRNDVTLLGPRSRPEVIAQLRRSRFYISTTRVENSYNNASEGIFLAGESYISDIGPHRELLAQERFDKLILPGVHTALLHTRRSHLRGVNLQSWHDVVTRMIATVRQAQVLPERPPCPAVNVRSLT